MRIKSDDYYKILEKKLNTVKEKVFKNKNIDINKLNKLINIFKSNKNIFKNEIPSLIHNDLWYKNILWDKNWFISIIDFETSIFSPKQVEIFRIYNHLFFAKNYFEHNPEEYKELDFLNKFIKSLETNYSELLTWYNNIQKLLFNIVTYFNMLSKYDESWYDNNEVEEYWNLIIEEIKKLWIDYS